MKVLQKLERVIQMVLLYPIVYMQLLKALSFQDPSESCTLVGL